MRIFICSLLLLSASVSVAQTMVDGYFRSDGSYVAPHVRSAPDNNPFNNYSSQGNTNPYTGQRGTRDPVQVQQSYSPPPVQQLNSSQHKSSYQNSRW